MGDSKELLALIYRLVFGEKNLLYCRSQNFRVNKLSYDGVENFFVGTTLYHNSAH